MTHPVLAAINAALERDQEDGMREHLGASVIGRQCDREIWYGFRWATLKRHAGRILRLFNRGHREEERFVGWLRAAGIEIDPFDPKTGEQWRISACNGHFGGSLDGIAWNIPTLPPDQRILVEFKTHGEKSFNKIVIEGVKRSKPEHYVQMQEYMHHKRLPLALYLAINKNTDEIHAEFVTYDAPTAELALGRAAHIIHSPFPPARISNDPSWFVCKFCDHKETCHLNKPMQVNCRTCIFSSPVQGGQWYCEKWKDVIPLQTQKKGCEMHSAITG